MPGAMSETQVVATELENVQSKVPVLFDRDDTFYSTIEKKNVEVVSARDMRIPLELRPGGNFGQFDPSGGSLGKGSGPTYDKATIGAVYLKYGVEYTKKAEWATDKSRKAVVNTVRRALASSMAEFRRHLDSACMGAGDGVVGVISNISTAGGKDTYTLATDGFGSRLIRYAQYLAVADTALGGKRVITPAGDGDEDGTDFINVDLVDIPAKQVRIGGAATGVIVGDKLVINGTTFPNPTSLLGVAYHHSDSSAGTWLGLSRANFPEIRSNRVNAAGTLALTHARLAINKIGDRLGRGSRSLVAWMHPCQAQAYEELGQAVSVINKGNREEGLNLFFGDDMTMAGVKVKTHFAWDKTRIDFTDSSLWGRGEIHPAGFYEEDGRKLFEVRDSNGYVKAATVFYIACAFNIFNMNPAGATFINGLTVPSGY